MRNHLHRLAQKFAAPLLVDHRKINLPGGVVRVARQRAVGEPLVMPQVEVGFAAVVEHVDFAMLIGAHRARIDVDIRIELLHPHRQPAGFEQHADRGAGEPLPSELTTPPVTKICLVMKPNSWKERVGNSRGVENGHRHRATTLIRPPNPRWLRAGPFFQHAAISIGTGGHEIVNPGRRRTIRPAFAPHSVPTAQCRGQDEDDYLPRSGTANFRQGCRQFSRQRCGDERATARPPCFARETGPSPSETRTGQFPNSARTRPTTRRLPCIPRSPQC